VLGSQCPGRVSLSLEVVPMNTTAKQDMTVLFAHSWTSGTRCFVSLAPGLDQGPPASDVGLVRRHEHVLSSFEQPDGFIAVLPASYTYRASPALAGPR